jgi:hypothetical protein
MRQKISGISRVKNWANHVQIWLDEPKAQVLKFENIIKNTHFTLQKISQDLKLTPLYQKPLLPKEIKSLWHGRWIRLTQKRPESTAIIGYYHNQKVQKWQSAFSHSDRCFFQAEAGDLLIKLGYEQSDSWI